MKHHVLPRELAKFWQKTFPVFKTKLNFLTDIVLRAQLKTVQTENSQFVVFTNLHLFYLTWLIICSSVLPKNRENYPPRYAHDSAVGPAAHLLDMVISCFSAKLGFQANYVRSERETSVL